MLQNRQLHEIKSKCGIFNITEKSVQWRKKKRWEIKKKKREQIQICEDEVRHRERKAGQPWRSLTLTESIFWQPSASYNNLEIISIHKGPAVWQSKCSVPDRSLRFSQLPVSVCTGSTSISGLLSPHLPSSLWHTEDKVRKRKKMWAKTEMG